MTQIREIMMQWMMALAVLAMISLPAMAQEKAADTAVPWSTEVTACDRLTAHGLDPHAVAPGQGRADILAHIEEAEAACRAAVAEDPENPRLNYQMGRLLGYSGRGEEAMPFRMKAVELDYPQSLFVIGFLYSTGNTIDRKDICRTGELWRKSAQKGLLSGQISFSRWAILGRFSECPSVTVDATEIIGFLTAADEQTDRYYEGMVIEDYLRAATALAEYEARNGTE